MDHAREGEKKSERGLCRDRRSQIGSVGALCAAKGITRRLRDVHVHVRRRGNEGASGGHPGGIARNMFDYACRTERRAATAKARSFLR